MTAPLLEALGAAWRALPHAAWQAALVGLLVLGACRLPGLRPRMRYVLVAIALVKFVTPPLWSEPVGWFGLISIREPAATDRPLLQQRRALGRSESPASGDPSDSVVASPSPEVEDASLSGSVPAVVSRRTSPWLWIYLLGAGVAAGLVAYHARALRRVVRRSQPAPPHLAASLEALQRELDRHGLLRGPRRPVRLLVSDDVRGPICFGVITPTVVLPSLLADRLDGEPRRLVLGHELTHLRHRDPWARAALTVVSIVYWFHPVFWMLYRELEHVQEDWCDDDTVERTGTDGERYCATLLSIAKEARGQPGYAFAMADHEQRLTRRFHRILSRSEPSGETAMMPRILMLSAALSLLPGVHLVATTNDPTQPGSDSLSGLVGEGGLVVTVDARGRVAAGDRVIDLEVLGQVARFVRESRPGVSALVEASPDAPVGALASVLQTLRDAGVETTVKPRVGIGGAGAVDAGLGWLASRQNDDGSWGASESPGMRASALSLLAFLGAGNTAAHGPHHAVVARGLDFLAASFASADGSAAGESSLGRAIAAVALVEGFGLSQQDRYRAAAEHALRASAASLRASTGADPELDYWLLLSQLSARDFALPADGALIDAALARIKARGPIGDAGADAAVGLLRILGGDGESARDDLAATAERVSNDAARATDDYGFAFFGAYLTYQLGGDSWQRWQAQTTDRILALQRATGPDAGAFPASDTTRDPVVATALNVLTLEVVYRYARLMSDGRG